ncbi:MAG: C-terminal helicase domain-containing protein, partial [Candidatus Dormibacteria bacterium]
DAEVRVCAQVVRLLDERVDPQLSLAVIAMYADQVDRLRQSLSRRHFRRPVKIDTVDSFEGREEDMVVISLVRSNERGRIGFLRVPNRLNVAISRARRLVVCVGDADTLRSGEESMYGRLVEAARACGGYLRATDLLGPRARPGRPVPRRAEGEEAGQPTGTRRHRRRRRRPAVPGEAVAAQVPGEAPPAGVHKRRRRRRRPAVGPDGQPVVSSTGQPGGAAAPPRRRRRRRRGGGAGGPGPTTTEGTPTEGGAP